MDILDQINAISDLKLRELLTHSVRYGMQHSLIASQAAASKEPAAQNAAVIHADTNALLMALVKQVLTDNAPAPKAPAKRAAKRK